jgi:peptide/nickel transport system substrate-binding protein
MVSKIFLVALTLSLTIAVLVTACSSTASPSASTTAKASPPVQATPSATVKSSAAPASPQYGGILKRHTQVGPSQPIGWPVEGSPTSTDPLNQVCFERLLIEMGDGSMAPWLATAYQIAPDKKSVTLTLRQGVKFHDGSDFNAQAVKFNLDAYITAKSSTAAAWSSVDVVDNNTVRVNLKQYQNTVIRDIGGILQVSPTAFQKNGLEGIRWNPVGTGPFKFSSFQRDVSLKYGKFNDYWQKGKPYLDGIEYIFIADFSAALMSFKSGQVDIFQSENSKMSYDLKNEGYTYGTQLPQCAGTLTLIPDSGTPNSQLADKLVRQAFEYGIDRESISTSLGYGFATPLYQVAPPQAAIAYIPDLPARKYDPAKAKQLLAQAGYPNGIKTRLIGDPRTTTKDLMVAIQSNLTAAGIQADVEFPQVAQFTDYRYNGWKNGFLCQLMSNFATYTAYYSFYWGGNQWTSTKLPEGFADQVKDVLSTETMDKAKIQKLNRLIYDESMVIPVNVQVVTWFWTKGLHDSGIFVTHHSYWSPSTAWLEKGVPLK